MSSAPPSLVDLAKSGAVKALEDRWFAIIESGEEDREDLLGALEVLNQNGRGDEAAALAWAWLTGRRESGSPEDLLALGRELILRCGENADLRNEIVRLYEEVFADRPELKKLLDYSGLSGGKSPRRALRTLEICLNLKTGDFLVSRSDEHVAEVTAIAPETCEYTLKTRRGELTLEADALALAYDPVDADDFRVLTQLRPERIPGMLESDPVGFVISVLKSHHGQIDDARLEHLISPRFIPAAKYKDWWSKAKTTLRRHRNVVVEGRSPVILQYHAAGQSLEEEMGPQWAAADTPAQRLAFVDTYFREAKARGSEPKREMIRRIHGDLMARLNTSRKGSPVDALREALIIDRLAELTKLPEPRHAPAEEILRDTRNLQELLLAIPEPPLLLRALAVAKTVLPDSWPELYADMLPLAPVEACDALAKGLQEARPELLEAALQRIPTDFTRHLDALCWLWRGPGAANVASPLSQRDLLLRLLNHLGDLARSDATPPEVLRDARLKLRAALSAGKYAPFRQVIEGMDAGLASTVRRTIERLDGLGQVVHATLLRIIQDTHPELYVRARIEPWLDENIILGTQAGMNKREEELNHLVNVKMVANAKAIGEAASHGDLSENSEYKFALEERDLLRARVAAIQNELAMARLLTENDVITDAVHVGTRVTLAPVEVGERREMTILGPWESDIEKGIYNYKAPLCGKLRGLQVGDTVRLDLDGTEREYRIEAIANALEGQR